ncbi:MAG: hypothetical protein IT305_22000 [Chloroflexi bacterium]|nr:hypothetical protein [Chloroflexota bacterium]
MQEQPHADVPEGRTEPEHAPVDDLKPGALLDRQGVRLEGASSRQDVGLEDALARAEAAADDVLKAAAALTRSLKRYHSAAQLGNLRDLHPAADAAEQALDEVRRLLDVARAGWDFDEDAYFANGAYAREVLETARRMDVRMFELDDRLYCYPALIRVAGADRSVTIDRARERRLRPSVLVAHLKDVQRRPPRFRAEAFLEALFAAYGHLVEKREGGQVGQGIVERLLDVYDLLTLMPGQARDYSRQEFARDVYLLDRSGVTRTRRGYVVSFPASTGARAASSTIRIVTESGQEKVYYGIAFARAEDA